MLTYGSLAKTVTNQPVSSGFFGQTSYLNEFLTPHNLQIEDLYDKLKGDTLENTIYNCWKWVASNVKYVPTVRGFLNVEGKVSKQGDLWAPPNLIASIRTGNCFNKSTLLVSLLRNALPMENVSLVLGNINSGGHAWTIVQPSGETYILETTQPNVKNPFVVAGEADIYEPVIFVNEVETSYIPDRQVKEPFISCDCVGWLTDYLDSKSCTVYV